jgi:hypothetical protein
VEHRCDERPCPLPSGCYAFGADATGYPHPLVTHHDPDAGRGTLSRSEARRRQWLILRRLRSSCVNTDSPCLRVPGSVFACC